MNTWKTMPAAIMLSFLAACAGTPTSQPGTGLQSGDGVIENINVVQADGNNVLGTVVGGVAGGLLGNQIGGGTGQTAATVAGVAAGAYAGNQIEKNRQQGKVAYQFGVRMENGLYQSVTQDSNPFRIGDPVRITDGKLMRR